MVNPKPKQSLRPITKDGDNPLNQSKLEASTCSRREATAKHVSASCEWVWFTPVWLRKWRKFFSDKILIASIKLSK